MELCVHLFTSLLGCNNPIRNYGTLRTFIYLAPGLQYMYVDTGENGIEPQRVYRKISGWGVTLRAFIYLAPGLQYMPCTVAPGLQYMCRHWGNRDRTPKSNER